MIKRPFFSLTLLLSLSIPCQADTLILKTGENIKGKLVKQDEKSYFLTLESTGEEKEVPISSVSIADLDPSAEGVAKSSVIFYSRQEKAASPKIAEPVRSSEPVSEPAPAPMNSVSDVLSKNDGNILKTTQETVALSNAKTAQVEKQLEELKKIADEATKS